MALLEYKERRTSLRTVIHLVQGRPGLLTRIFSRKTAGPSPATWGR